MSRRALETLLRSLQFAAVTDPVLKAKLKDANRVWLSRANKKLRDRKVLLPSVLRRRQTPWSTAHSLSRSVPLHFPPPSVVIHTDASLSGWGGHAPSQTVQGTWSSTFQQFHINVLDAMAVFLSLKRLKPKRNSHIRLLLDSQVIAHCINRRGSESNPINHVMIAIFLWPEREIGIYPRLT